MGDTAVSAAVPPGVDDVHPGPHPTSPRIGGAGGSATPGQVVYIGERRT